MAGCLTFKEREGTVTITSLSFSIPKRSPASSSNTYQRGDSLDLTPDSSFNSILFEHHYYISCMFRSHPSQNCNNSYHSLDPLSHHHHVVKPSGYCSLPLVSVPSRLLLRGAQAQHLPPAGLYNTTIISNIKKKSVTVTSMMIHYTLFCFLFATLSPNSHILCFILKQGI